MKYKFVVSNILFLIKTNKNNINILNMINHYKNNENNVIEKIVEVEIKEVPFGFINKKEENMMTYKKVQYYHNKFLYEKNNIFLFLKDEILVKKISNEKIIVENSNIDSIHKFLVRLIREYVYRYYENKGFISFHSGCTYINEDLCLILGPSGAGKTTLICKLAENGCFPISNDRALINKNLELKTIPLHYRIAYGTIINTNKIYDYSTKNLDFLYKKNKLELNYKDITLKSKDGYFLNKKLELTQLEIENCFNLTKKNLKDKIKYIIIPKISIEDKVIQISKINDKEAIDILMKEKYTPDDKNWKENWIMKVDYKKFDYYQIIKKILKEVIFIKVEYSPGEAYKLKEKLKEFKF